VKGKDCDVRLQNRRVLGAGVLMFGAALVLAGCGAGQITQTDSQQPAVNGTYAQVKTIALRDVAVQYPPQGPGYAAGAKPSLTLTIINQGTQDDTLVSVALDNGATGTLGGAKTIVAGHTLVIGPADAAESTNEAAPSSAPATTSEAPTSPATPTGTATSTSSSQAPSSSVTEPTTTAAAGEVGKGTITLPPLPQPLWPGQVIKVVFTFQNAGSITIDVPIAAPAHVTE